MGIHESLLGARIGWGLPGVRIRRCSQIERQPFLERRFAMVLLRWSLGRMGDRYRIPGLTRLSSLGVSGLGTNLAPRASFSLEGDGRNYAGRRGVYDHIGNLSARRLWLLPPKLLLLRSRLPVRFYANPRIFWTDLSSPRRGTEASFRMPARNLFRCASRSRRPHRAALAVEREDDPFSGDGCNRNRCLLSVIQRLVSCMDGWCVLWSSLRRRCHSVVLSRFGSHLEPRYFAMAHGACRISCL